ncbi:MAG TPA: amylo-alpha-1,6-glucosidase [Terriglobia bacterium]|nr:amylo-alpha-1,6-glucosidase [Terriglobia bacterium]
MIVLDQDRLQDFGQVTSREWLETNGIGGFASSTVAGLNTRRYHGLLIAALRPPTGRVALLSKIEETLVVDGQRYDIGSNQYAGAVHPRGYLYLESFRLDPFPICTFRVEGVQIEKSVFLVANENTVVIQYRISGQNGRAVSLEIRPLIAFRDYHSLTRENAALDARVEIHDPQLASVRPYNDHPRLYLAHNAGAVGAQGYWYRNFEYARERERGLDCVEDLFNPLTLHFDLSTRSQGAVIASTAAPSIADAGRLRKAEVRRRARTVAPLAGQGNLVETLAAAADQYIVSRGDQKTVIAGYPWFTDWGRDTMIALSGLTLTTGRHDVAESILVEFARHVDRGMLPNRFPDDGEAPEYNTIDATLWYFEAVRALIEHTGKYAFALSELYPTLKQIIDWHVRGTRYGIHMDEDGLVESTDAGVQLTWMDAKIGDWVVTPRNGKAVEIQALWYNALRTIQDIARRAGDVADAERYRALADMARRSFNDQFWNEDTGHLYDVVGRESKDGTMRPNQILAVSLCHSMLERRRARAVVDAVERDLFTPYGLRSLAPSDPQYRRRYEGDPVARDSAYHQGPVWAWLLGPFIDAYLKVNGRSRKPMGQARRWLSTMESHLGEEGLGHVSEIFDGDAPHRPRGCFAQAWSVAEILRAVVENGLAGEPGTLRRRRETRGELVEEEIHTPDSRGNVSTS